MSPGEARRLVHGWRIAAVLGVLGVAACSGPSEAPLLEYPPVSEPGATIDPEPDRDRDAGGSPSSDATAPPQPVAGKKIADGAIFVRGVTTDGALVFEQDADLMVWPSGAAAPIRVVQDFSSGEDVFVIRGRFVAVWLGENVAASSPTVWAKTGGVQTVAPNISAYGLYPKAASDDFAYLTPGTSSLRRDVWATTAGAGVGTKIVSGLDLGYPREECRYTIAYAATGLVVAGCPTGATEPKIVVHALDGASAPKTILDGSAPGIFFNRARTRAIVQTSIASSIRSLSGSGAPVPLDGPVRQATFSADDANVVYLDAGGTVKRASASSPASPVEVAPSALAILGQSPDLRFVLVATRGDVSSNRTDVVAIDTTTSSGARTLVQQGGGLVGMSKSGTQVVYFDDAKGALHPPLWAATLPSGAPRKISEASAFELVSDDVVYWLELVKATKSNVLKAAKLSNLSDVVTIEEALDPLTTHMTVVGKKLFVASKLGLWEYPTL